jgi:hypothetical protein
MKNLDDLLNFFDDLHKFLVNWLRYLVSKSAEGLIRSKFRAALSIQIINSASSGDLPKSSN